MLSENEIKNIRVVWKTLPYPEIKERLQRLYHEDMSFLDLISALYWEVIQFRQEEIIKREEEY